VSLFARSAADSISSTVPVGNVQRRAREADASEGDRAVLGDLERTERSVRAHHLRDARVTFDLGEELLHAADDGRDRPLPYRNGTRSPRPLRPARETGRTAGPTLVATPTRAPRSCSTGNHRTPPRTRRRTRARSRRACARLDEEGDPTARRPQPSGVSGTYRTSCRPRTGPRPESVAHLPEPRCPP
jgi:hypothetical protein